MMYPQKARIRMSRHQQGPRHRTMLGAVQWSLRCLLAIPLCYGFMQSTLLFAHGATLAQGQPLVTQEIRYHMPEAAEVFLVWGINGWAVVPEEIRPAGTVVKKVMHTPMVYEGDTFVAKVQVPAGATIDYGFLITKKRNDAAVRAVWEGAHGDPVIATQDGVVEVQTMLTLAYGQVTAIVANVPLVSQEIRYHLPEADEVFLVWGINGWVLVPEENRPAGTVVKKGVMHTPMAGEGDTFVAKVQVPRGATIDYVFLITKTRGGAKNEVWDANGDQGYHTVAEEGGIANIAFVTQEIRYHLPEAGEVFLVWGINGWTLVPEEIRPAETVVKDAKMYTPMVREGDTFVAKVQVPAGATIDYVFLITKTRSGAASEVWDASGDLQQDYHTVAMRGGIVGMKGTLTPGQAKTSTSVLDVRLYLLIGITIIFGIGAILCVVPLHNRRALALALICLTLLGLVLRLWVAWDTNQRLPDTSARLSGDEASYDELAYLLLRGCFFQRPGRVPIYPLFLMACYLVLGHSYATVLYVQAFVGAAAIPLTFLLARHFTSVRLSLLAAALIALHPTLILHVTRLSSGILYTPLLLLALLSLLWALETLVLRRFVLAGALLAVVNLCRPTAVLFPVLLPLLLPRTWSRGRKMTLCLAYAGAMVVIIAPWSYHNYRTYDAFLPLSVSEASLWQGSPEFFHLMESRWSISQIENWYLNPERNGGHDRFSIEGDRYFTARALDSIWAEPDVYVVYSLLKLSFFWIGHPAIDWPDYAIFSVDAMRPYYSTLRIAGIFAARLLPLVALVWLIILRAVHGRLRYLTPLLAVCGYFMLVHAITYPQVRFSEPLYPILATIIVAAVLPREYAPVRLGAGAQRQWYYT